MSTEKSETATLAAGCFWCLEAVFGRLHGIEKVVSGYTGGTTQHPTYRDVCNGVTGHAEAVQITFDPEIISFTELLDVFWKIHDPTTLNRQGADVGTQYRSAIFYHNDSQRELAEKSKDKTEKEDFQPGAIITEIVPFTRFHQAEKEHWDYYRRNRYQPYCQIVIDPKIKKIEKVFADKLKEY